MGNDNASARTSAVPDPPFYVRKIDRSGWWSETGGLSEREIAGKVFPPEEDGAVSVFRVENEVDLRRVAIGLNSRRSSLHEELVLLPIRPDELKEIPLRKTLGDTLCLHANNCHYDAVFGDEGAAVALVRALRARGRSVRKLKSKEMKSHSEEAERDGCRATSSVRPQCVCQERMLRKGDSDAARDAHD